MSPSQSERCKLVKLDKSLETVSIEVDKKNCSSVSLDNNSVQYMPGPCKLVAMDDPSILAISQGNSLVDDFKRTVDTIVKLNELHSKVQSLVTDMGQQVFKKPLKPTFPATFTNVKRPEVAISIPPAAPPAAPRPIINYPIIKGPLGRYGRIMRLNQILCEKQILHEKQLLQRNKIIPGSGDDITPGSDTVFPGSDNVIIDGKEMGDNVVMDLRIHKPTSETQNATVPVATVSGTISGTVGKS